MRKGFNRWRLEKAVNNVKVYMNLFKVADFDLTMCTAAYYYINLYAEQIGGDVIFNNVKVNYKGTII